MQNWAHTIGLFDALNQQPTQQRDTDFSRVRSWFLDGAAARLRQTVMLCAHPAAELQALARASRNVAGRVECRPTFGGVLGRVPPTLRQLFVRFAVDLPLIFVRPPRGLFCFFFARSRSAFDRHCGKKI